MVIFLSSRRMLFGYWIYVPRCGKVSLFLCTKGGCWRTNICCFCFPSLPSLLRDSTPFLRWTVPPLLHVVLGTIASCCTLGHSDWPRDVTWLNQASQRLPRDCVCVALLSSGVTSLVWYMLEILTPRLLPAFPTTPWKKPDHSRRGGDRDGGAGWREREKQRDRQIDTHCGHYSQASFEDPSFCPVGQ